jgi:RPA family protein
MEGATRVFAGDFSGSTLSVPADEAESPAWVVTPGGAWCRSLYLCGALTEVVETADVLHCRLADPTGAFDVVSGGRRAAITEQIRTIPVPSFIAVTGTAQLYRRNGGDAVSVRPEYVQVIDRAVRDRWIMVTADMTLARLELLLAAL